MINLTKNKKTISIIRRHGLGNVILLLPVLNYLHSKGHGINLVTREEWVDVFSDLCPEFEVSMNKSSESIDLDKMTLDIHPTKHRTDELASLLGLKDSMPNPNILIPSEWGRPYRELEGNIVFAPEATHPSRCWPIEYCNELRKGLKLGKKLILVGINNSVPIDCDIDLRGNLQLKELFGIVSVAGVVITMDSAVLHIASAIKKPTVAIFGGVDAKYRILPNKPVVVLQSKMDCCPCNKAESCNDTYDCIKNINATHVLQAIDHSMHAKCYIDFL